jgi:predicted nucleotidyltransferase
MNDPGYTPEDLELFADLDQAARTIGLEPCLIGAGAIQLGPDLRWRVRLARKTRDWDFAVRVDSWRQYEALSVALVSADFQRSVVPHRFHHDDGGLLDVVPYGNIEHPPGSLEWPGGVVMSTAGLTALDQHHAVLRIESVELRAATIPAVIGLKLLAYRDRRPAIVRDIQDVHAMLRQAEDCVSPDRIAADALLRLKSDDVAYPEIGAYILGHDVGKTFDGRDAALMEALLASGEELADRMVGDVVRSSDGPRMTRELVTDRLRAFRLGIQDGNKRCPV